LLPQKADPGSEKNKTAPRKIDKRISIPNRTRHIEQGAQSCKRIFAFCFYGTAADRGNSMRELQTS
jgi:hypothetical protein